MKSGASDPFADDPPSTESADDSERSDGHGEAESEPLDDPETPASNTDQFDRSDLPYTLRREKVKDERDGVHQLFVRDDTEANERNARRDLEDRFDEDLYKLDAREAIYLAGMQNLDDAESVLREWGYDL